MRFFSKPRDIEIFGDVIALPAGAMAATRNFTAGEGAASGSGLAQNDIAHRDGAVTR